MPRIRIHPQSKAVFVGNSSGILDAHRVPIQLPRVQSVSASIDLAGARRDVRELGSSAPLSRPIISSDISVELSLSYFLLDGGAENLLGINIANTGFPSSCISDFLLDPISTERNFYILTVPEGRDAKGRQLQDDVDFVTTISRASLSNYSLSAAVGDIPTVQITAQGTNYADQKVTEIAGEYNVYNTAITEDGAFLDYNYVQFPVANTGSSLSDILRPGDITLNLGGVDLPMGGADLDTAHVQSFQLQMPLARESIQRLGSLSAFAKPLQIPFPVTFSISALTSEIDAGALNSLMTGCSSDNARDISVSIARRCDTGVNSISFALRNVLLDSYSFSSSVDNNNETFDAQFSAMISGPEDLSNGLFMSGSYDHNYVLWPVWQEGDFSDITLTGSQLGNIDPLVLTYPKGFIPKAIGESGGITRFLNLMWSNLVTTSYGSHELHLYIRGFVLDFNSVDTTNINPIDPGDLGFDWPDGSKGIIFSLSDISGGGNALIEIPIISAIDGAQVELRGNLPNSGDSVDFSLYWS
jgi:hypothetical protein